MPINRRQTILPPARLTSQYLAAAQLLALHLQVSVELSSVYVFIDYKLLIGEHVISKSVD